MAVKNGLKFFDIKGRIFNLKKKSQLFNSTVFNNFMSCFLLSLG